VGGVAKDTIANIEVVLGGFGSDVIAAPFVDGFFGDDVLRGTATTNFLSGNRGNDTVDYRDKTLSVVAVLPPSDQDTIEIVAGDTADVTVGTQHDFLAGIENVWGGSAGDTITGNDVANRLSGFAGNDALAGGKANDTLDGGIGNDLLDGGLGADTMRGGAGNDTYVVDNAGDVVDESAGGSGGIDLVKSSVTFSLSDAVHVKGTVENLTLLGGAPINGRGNGLANTIAGNSGANILAGDLGNDLLTGGAGNDTILFDTKPNKTANVDHITDFLPGADVIELDQSIFTKIKIGDGHLKHSAFHAGKHAHDGNDRIIYNAKTGELSYDKDGDGDHHAKLFAVLDNSPNDLNASDFLIVA
jgi:Ca2+-binding RTX toxin-like protein